MRDYQNHILTWRGIRIRVRYCPEWSESYRRNLGYGLAHLELDAIGHPLPVTCTGYRSHFTRPDVVEHHGGPVAFVQAWLNSEARTKTWRKAYAESRQLALF